ncbi:TonB-dependent receptor [Paraglaciecola sp.]|uniref:TonB-dependent receptor n=1 Tax=Paraglaciecola sp. TaxID=1920173 RepID=UPI0030F3A762
MFVKKSILSLVILFALIAESSAHTPDIDTITVTATRQSSQVSELSSNMAWLNEAELSLLEPQHIQQALSRIAGAWISRGNGQEHLTALRSPVLTGAGSCGAFFMAEDGISLRAPGFCNANQLFDTNSEQAARIEVVKGSNSVLYGSNAVHGVINIITPDAWQVQEDMFSIEAGPHDYWRGKFRLAQQGKDQALLVYGLATTDGGYQTDSGFKQQKLNLVHQSSLANWQVKSNLAVSNLKQQTAGFIEGFEAYKDHQTRRINANPEAYRDAYSLRAYSQFSYQSNANTSFRITPYLRSNSMEFLQHYVPWQPVEKNSHRSLGLQSQFEQQYANVQLLSGFDWDQSWGELSEFQPDSFSATIPQGMHYDYSVISQVYSPFVQLNWQLNPSTSVLAGLRFEYTELDYNNRLSGGSACASDVAVCRFIRPSDTQLSYRQWSNKLALRHQLGDNASLYAQWSEGYRVPQTSELFRLQDNQNQTDLVPEQSQSMEVGIRANMFATYIDFSSFYLVKDNVILQDTQRQTINEGSTSHRGLELSLRSELTQNLYLAAVATYAIHRYDSALTSSQQDIADNDIDTAPKNMGSVQLGWQTDAGQQIEVEYVSMGSYFLDPQNSATYAGHGLVNLRSSFMLSDSLRLSLRLLNLTNQDYAERADIAFGNYRYFVGEPRSVFVTLALSL